MANGHAKKWNILSEFKIQNSKFKIDDLITALLANRGITSEKDREAFLNSSLKTVTVNSVGLDLKEIDKSIARIKKAIEKKEQIVVFGDYDVDGITASAILWETLVTLGAKVLPYIPHRIDEGYGLSLKGIENVLSLKISNSDKFDPSATKLIITVDNGIVAHQAIDFANEKGIDVIITDHHVKDENVPDAFAIIHTTKLCGAGVAYLLSQEIKKQIAKSIDSNDDHLELAAMGTLADMVPLTDANRAIVKFGLREIQKSNRVGLVALFREIGCDQSTAGIYEVGHMVVPRLNAAGRLTSAMDSLRLLCTKDITRASLLASKLGQTNRDRQGLMFAAADHAASSFRTTEKEMSKLLFIVSESYQQGVIGLVAGRLVEEFYRPAIVIAKGEKYSKGSARSVHGFNMIEFLRGASEYLIDVGGHPMAAGFTVETEKIDTLHEVLEKIADGLIDADTLTRTLRVDCAIPFEIINQNLYMMLQELAPFGIGNPEPTFASYDVEVVDKRLVGKDGKHVKLQLSVKGTEQSVFDAIAFGLADAMISVNPGDSIDIVYTIDENVWNGNVNLQLKIKDIKTKLLQ